MYAKIPVLIMTYEAWFVLYTRKMNILQVVFMEIWIYVSLLYKFQRDSINQIVDIYADKIQLITYRKLHTKNITKFYYIYILKII